MGDTGIACGEGQPSEKQEPGNQQGTSGRVFETMSFYYARVKPRNPALGHLRVNYSHRLPSGEYRAYKGEKGVWYAIDDAERAHLLTVKANPLPEAPCAFDIVTPQEKAEMERSAAQRLMDRKQVVVQEVVGMPTSVANIPAGLLDEVKATEEALKEEVPLPPVHEDLTVEEVRGGRGRGRRGR